MSATLNETRKYILAVDDNPDNLFLIQLALEQEGHTILLVDNGYAALEQIKQFPPSLILLDVMMPEMDGYQLTQLIRQDKNIPFIPILLITAHEESSLVQGLDSGADEFIRKPVQIDELQARVRSMLRLKETIDQRESFVSCLTHDLRTPLVAANRMLTLIQQKAFGETTPETAEAVDRIIDSNNNMLQMLNTLLETHHYEVGQKILSSLDLDLQQLIETVIKELEPLANEKGLKLQFNRVSQLPNIKGDSIELRRVFTNLIGNAIKYSDRGAIEVSVTYQKPEISIEIKDTGVGISPQDLKVIFERYHQGKNRRAGKGLGLYLCQQIIQAHRGKIFAKSKLGEGTTFKVILPI
jgi:signal transduction histidine kinase